MKTDNEHPSPMIRYLILQARAGPAPPKPRVRTKDNSVFTDTEDITMFHHSQNAPPASGFWRSTALALSLAASGALLPLAAQAQLAAGTTISNQATVNFKDAAGNAQTAATSNTVNVTVALVGALSWGAAPAGQTVPSGTALSPSYTFTLINGGNGADTVTLSHTATQSTTDLAAGSFTLTGDVVNSITLFGTIASGAGVFGGANTTIPVYYQDTANLTAGTTVVRIGGSNFTVTAGSTATQLVVVGNATAVATGAGVQIGEVGTITLSGTVGVLSAPSTTATHNHSISATGTAQGGNAAATPAAALTWSTTVTRVAISVVKYVRNFTDNNDNAAGVTTIVYPPVTGNTYYQSGITGNANGGSGGDNLEYLIVITNTGGGNATDVTFTDTLSANITYVAGSAQLDTNGDGTWDVAVGVGGETDGVDAGGKITYSAGTLTIRAGTGGNENTPVGGTIVPGATSVILFQANIN